MDIIRQWPGNEAELVGLTTRADKNPSSRENRPTYRLCPASARPRAGSRFLLPFCALVKLIADALWGRRLPTRRTAPHRSPEICSRCVSLVQSPPDESRDTVGPDNDFYLVIDHHCVSLMEYPQNTVGLSTWEWRETLSSYNSCKSLLRNMCLLETPSDPEYVQWGEFVRPKISGTNFTYYCSRLHYSSIIELQSIYQTIHFYLISIPNSF